VTETSGSAGGAAAGGGNAGGANAGGTTAGGGNAAAGAAAANAAQAGTLANTGGGTSPHNKSVPAGGLLAGLAALLAVVALKRREILSKFIR
jgi:hypothetical protein